VPTWHANLKLTIRASLEDAKIWRSPAAHTRLLAAYYCLPLMAQNPWKLLIDDEICSPLIDVKWRAASF
jgi:hypothetical protein